MSVFVNLISVLNKVNNSYIVYYFGYHNPIIKTLLNSYESFGVNNHNHEPAILDNGDKFVLIKINYYGYYSYSLKH